MSTKARHAVWARLTAAANASTESASFLYRRALWVALENAAAQMDVAPARTLGAVMISYQNLATYCERQGDAGQQERYFSQAYAYMEGLLLYPRTSARVRFVALEYLEIALKELGTVLERADRVDELETLLTAHVQLVDGACSSSGDGLRSRDHHPLY